MVIYRSFSHELSPVAQLRSVTQAFPPRRNSIMRMRTYTELADIRWLETTFNYPEPSTAILKTNKLDI